MSFFTSLAALCWIELTTSLSVQVFVCSAVILFIGLLFLHRGELFVEVFKRRLCRLADRLLMVAQDGHLAVGQIVLGHLGTGDNGEDH